jgi:hypothetical protein
MDHLLSSVEVIIRIACPQVKEKEFQGRSSAFPSPAICQDIILRRDLI